ncbi:hypothetical protein [Embleya sp. AB8]|uniref:hypothetical protein n=1 Tax=Embleya sp. AB8 TaxID=3156304 RepID=UPI003C776CAE
MMTGITAESSNLAHHLLMDTVIKVVLVVVALVVLAIGMVVIWRRAGRPNDRSGGTDDR